MTENIGQIEARVQEMVEAVKSTLESALKGFKQVQETVDGAKAGVDEVLERVKGMMPDTAERLKPTAHLLEHVQQNPWLLLGGALLVGYLLNRPARERASDRQSLAAS